MTNILDYDILGALQKFYVKLDSKVRHNERSLIRNSILLSLIKITKNKASKYLNNSSISIKSFNPQTIKRLVELGLIRNSDEHHDAYILTAKGIWEVEISREQICLNDILEFFQTNYLTFSVIDRPLKLLEKVILLSMIGARTFSKKTSMNLTRNESLDSWMSIFQESLSFLSNHNIKNKGSIPTTKQGNEHPVPYIMRRANDLPIKTHHIFVYAGSQEYYLDVSIDQEEISIDKIKYLISRIFTEIDSISTVKEISSFLIRLAHEKGLYVRQDFEFIDLSIDSKIDEAITSVYKD